MDLLDKPPQYASFFYGKQQIDVFRLDGEESIVVKTCYLNFMSHKISRFFKGMYSCNSGVDEAFHQKTFAGSIKIAGCSHSCVFEVANSYFHDGAVLPLTIIVKWGKGVLFRFKAPVIDSSDPMKILEEYLSESMHAEIIQGAASKISKYLARYDVWVPNCLMLMEEVSTCKETIRSVCLKTWLAYAWDFLSCMAEHDITICDWKMANVGVRCRSTAKRKRGGAEIQCAEPAAFDLEMIQSLVVGEDHQCKGRGFRVGATYPPSAAWKEYREDSLPSKSTPIYQMVLFLIDVCKHNRTFDMTLFDCLSETRRTKVMQTPEETRMELFLYANRVGWIENERPVLFEIIKKLAYTPESVFVTGTKRFLSDNKYLFFK